VYPNCLNITGLFISLRGPANTLSRQYEGGMVPRPSLKKNLIVKGCFAVDEEEGV